MPKVVEKVGAPTQEDQDVSSGEGGDESVNLPEFADQKNAGQALGANGSDRQRECNCLHNAIQRRFDGIEACGSLKAQLQAVSRRVASRETH